MTFPQKKPKREEVDSLQAIYADIPAVIGCRTGCNDCCGPVPMTTAEARTAAPMVQMDALDDRMVLTPTRCGTCMFSTPKGCSIYERRPVICRMFGAVNNPRLTCPHGAHADKPLTDAQGRDLVERWRRLSI